MSQDYPDWTRLFHLVGTDITIPINIEASAVTLPISIDAATITLDVNLVATEVTMPVSIDAAAVTIDVNLTASTVTIDINFSDQSVAVFDAAKWFAHQAQQIFIYGTATVNNNMMGTVCARNVPGDKTFFITGVGYGMAATALPYSSLAILTIANVETTVIGGRVGAGIAFDTPLRVAAGTAISLVVGHWGSGANLVCSAGFWGYDEAV